MRARLISNLPVRSADPSLGRPNVTSFNAYRTVGEGARLSRAYGYTAYGGSDLQTFLELPTPEPAPGQILVRVRAAGVNPVDWKVREGLHRAFLPLSLPAVFGREVAGVVESIGADVDRFAVGDA